MDLRIPVCLMGAVAILVGCATVSLPISELKSVPNERITWKGPAAADPAILIIARDAGFTGVAATAMVSIDGMAVAEVEEQEFLRLPLAPGRRAVSVWIRAQTGDVLFKPRSLDVTLAAGGTALLRIGFDDGARGFSVWQEVAP